MIKKKIPKKKFFFVEKFSEELFKILNSLNFVSETLMYFSFYLKNFLFFNLMLKNYFFFKMQNKIIICFLDKNN